VNVITTVRLVLRSGTREALIADLEGTRSLAAVLDVLVPDNWPPHLYDEPAIRWTLDRMGAGQQDSFLLYYWTLPCAGAAPVLIGLGGFKGPPRNGRVDIGYSVLNQFQRQGYATEAVAGLIAFAFGQQDIDEVGAETLPSLAASIGVLKKNGFRLVGPGAEEGIIRFALTRAEWQSNGSYGSDR
jgi:RimJ/RimL family protein N-acetyltransferase